ncbi:MAG TPA: VOC family protein [Geminicoccus sp.]|uniref:VOC family protein n=1 Tax=Geminicoccus sp. TaxID=2024832 RepID=UPI002B95CB5C|nr:VOC family protein [Geminicoccus sp.]HWL68244.1 VOC family protein [Geminicoccus sp.]
MISYLTLGTNDLERAGRFYDAALAPLGRVRLPAYPNEIWYGPPGGPTELVILHPFDGRPATWGNGITVGLSVPDEATVQAIYTAALAAGGLDEGVPGPRPQYSADFYAAYVRDPDGNKLAFVRATQPG